MSGGSPFSPSWFGRLRRHFTFRRALVNTGMVIYCLALLLLFDFVYSTLTAGEDARRARIPNPVYDHGLLPISTAMTSGARFATGSSRTASASKTDRSARCRCRRLIGEFSWRSEEHTSEL